MQKQRQTFLHHRNDSKAISSNRLCWFITVVQIKIWPYFKTALIITGQIFHETNYSVVCEWFHVYNVELHWPSCTKTRFFTLINQIAKIRTACQSNKQRIFCILVISNSKDSGFSVPCCPQTVMYVRYCTLKLINNFRICVLATLWQSLGKTAEPMC